MIFFATPLRTVVTQKFAKTTTREHAALPAHLKESTDAPFATAVDMAGTRALGREKLTSNQKMPSPLKHDVLNKFLSTRPDKDSVNMQLEISLNGAEIGFADPRYNCFTENALPARIHSDVLLKSILKEVSLDHTAGPFSTPLLDDFVVSTLGVRARKPGGFRIILDLSHPKGDSINDYNDRETNSLSYCSLDYAVEIVTLCEKGCLKQDSKNAFRLIPVREADWSLLDCKHKGL